MGGTKDGNVLGRLRGFARSLAGKQVHGLAPAQPLPSARKRGPPVALQAHEQEADITCFLDNCGLSGSDEAWDTLAPLAADALEVVLQNFDPSGTKDGNVLGRLRGF